MSNKKTITTFGGGVGAGKFLRGLYNFNKEFDLRFIVNTSDDIDIYDVRVSPDIDSVLYWISGIVDKERGWGLKNDNFEMVNSNKSYWFNLGDKDLEYNKLKKKLLDQGLKLNEFIKIKMDQLEINNISIFPMTNDKVETYLNLDIGDAHIQEFLIKYKMKPKINDIKFRGIQDAKPLSEVLSSIESSDMIIFCPSNPFISIDPIINLKGVRDQIEKSKAIKIAISPIVNGIAFQGPILKFFELNSLPPSVEGVAEYYKNLAQYIVIDKSDYDYKGKIEKIGLLPVFDNIKMVNDNVSINLATTITKILY